MPDEMIVQRREFLTRGAIAVAALAGYRGAVLPWSAPEPGRLTARPRAASKTTAAGEHVLYDDGGRRGLLYVPPGYDPKKPAPFFLALHGASGSGDSILRGTRPPAEAHGVVVLSPSSRGTTWDAIRGGYDSDLSRIDTLLADVFDRCAIDPARMAIGGFSDGATYALSVGLLNGDLFTHIVAHSPGFIIPGRPHGQPKVFVSHGRQDPILPIDRCGRRVVAQLKKVGYAVRFDEFDGGHTASPEMREAAMRWFVA